MAMLREHADSPGDGTTPDELTDMPRASRIDSATRNRGLDDPTMQVQDEYWDILMNTKKKEDGLDGVGLWNQIYPKIRDQESAIRLVKEIIDSKIAVEGQEPKRKWFDQYQL